MIQLPVAIVTETHTSRESVPHWFAIWKLQQGNGANTAHLFKTLTKEKYKMYYFLKQTSFFKSNVYVSDIATILPLHHNV